MRRVQVFILSLLITATMSGLSAQKKPGKESAPKVETTQTESAEIEVTEKEAVANEKPGKPEPLTEWKQLQLELDNTTEPGTVREEPVSWGWQILRTLFTLAFLLAIFYLFYRFYLFRKTLPAANSSTFKILQEFPLQPGRMLQLVDMKSRILVLGLSDSNIQLITEIKDRDSIEQIRLDCEKDGLDIKPDFFMELTRTIKDKVKDFTVNVPGENSKPGGSNSFEGQRNESLNRLRNLRKKRDILREDESL
ncbi:MAG: flagellar biosynthetic protein FliO [Leptospiraceae bacterium]|nr:flagellar biosynthetic protein FliO [Leptospiraceae bacterium]